MARDVITLRPVPAGEPCARVGDSGYAEIAFLQCRRYIALLRLAIGPEPDGARLRVRRSDTDFDPYIDVVVEYDDQNPAASDYALRCERDAPTRWRESLGPTVESAKTPEKPIRAELSSERLEQPAWRSRSPEVPEPSSIVTGARATGAMRDWDQARGGPDRAHPDVDFPPRR